MSWVCGGCIGRGMQGRAPSSEVDKLPLTPSSASTRRHKVVLCSSASSCHAEIHEILNHQHARMDAAGRAVGRSGQGIAEAAYRIGNLRRWRLSSFNETAGRRTSRHLRPRVGLTTAH